MEIIICKLVYFYCEYMVLLLCYKLICSHIWFTFLFFGVLQAFAEADTFFCFVELLSGFRDHFCQQLDNSVVGIRSTITKLSRLLKEHDEELWRHLEVTTKVRFLCCLGLLPCNE
ncbi:hypothetical protein CsSME_00020333 [Camellia sinensis var. sinensis]